MGWSRQPAAAQFRVHWQAQGQGAAASVRLVRCRRRTSALIFAMGALAAPPAAAMLAGQHRVCGGLPAPEALAGRARCNQ